MKKELMGFIKRVENETQKRGASITIKYREGQGVILEQQLPENANHSGLTNSGSTFHPAPEWHSVTKNGMEKWAEFLKSDKANEFYKTMADQEGVYVILDNTRILVLKTDETPGKAIYSI